MTADVVVVGAGPAGAGVALLLARAGVRVTLLDRGRFPREKPCGESFGPGVRAFFARHGVTLPRESTAIRGFRLHAGQVGLSIPFRSSGREATGFAACRTHLDAKLVEAAVAAGATLLEETVGLALAGEDGAAAGLVYRRLGATGSIAAPLVVGAGGLGCPVARALGGRRTPGRVALLAHLEGVQGLTDFGEAHLVGRGFVGIAPLGAARANVAAVLDRRDLRRGGTIDPEALWRSAVTGAGLSPRLARAERIGPLRAAGPLGFRPGARVAPGAMLLGDAAGFVDPFTGDGVAVALCSVELAAPVILTALARGGATAAALAPYAHTHHRDIAPRLLFDWVLRRAARFPGLAAKLVATLAQRPELAERLLAVPADLAPPSSLLSPDLLLPLLRAALRLTP